MSSAETSYLKSLNKEELNRVARVCFSSGNHLTLTHIDKINKDVLKTGAPIYKDDNVLFEVCKKGNIESLEFLRSKKFDIDKRDEKGNSCLHYAAKWGNIHLIEAGLNKNYFDPNQVNLNNETPLHLNLKEGGYKYCQTAMLLASINFIKEYNLYVLEHTNLLLKDNDNKEPHRVRLLNLKDNFRLEDFLKKMHERQVSKLE